MKIQSYVPVYTITLLLSAFLLFFIQPMFGKMILPLLGGTPSVWNTAMLFFQVTLLAGYAYAHGTTRLLGIRAQAIIHALVVAVFTLVLPIAIPDGWIPPADKDPTFWQLGLMAVVVGGPFFALAGTAPMLQRWFSATDHPDAHNPYFLYAASNLGSMTALLAYPVVFEPLMTLQVQTGAWMAGYIALIGLIVLCAMLVWRHIKDDDKAGKSSEVPEVITWGRRGMWLILAFTPSSLMLGVTTFITTDIASAPLLWIVPLAIYVGTFIIAFARKEVLSYRALLWIHTVALAFVISFTVLNFRPGTLYMVILHLMLFSTSALACHIDLARLRPHAGHLTEFYLIMSFGGALGGVFNALIAPNIFVLPIEYVLVLSLACFLRFASIEKHSFANFKSNLLNNIREGKKGGIITFGVITLLYLSMSFGVLALENFTLAAVMAFVVPLTLVFLFDRRWMFAVIATIGLVLSMGISWNLGKDSLYWGRNFFGVVRVVNTKYNYRIMTHGTTMHGAQPTIPELELLPISYYYKKTSVGDVFRIVDEIPGPHKIAGLGLGAGSIACFRKAGRSIDFFEIDPEVVHVAENPEYFTYLSNCGTPYEVFLGDGRLKIAERPDSLYDMIFLDVFSSDNIPVHVMTVEAFEIYKKKLKPDGLIVMNISNRYLDLRPVLSAIAREIGYTVVFKATKAGIIDEGKIPYTGTIFAVMSKDSKALDPFRAVRWEELPVPESKPAWRDDYANIVGAFVTFSPYPIKPLGPEDEEETGQERK